MKITFFYNEETEEMDMHMDAEFINQSRIIKLDCLQDCLAHIEREYQKEYKSAYGENSDILP